MMESLPLILVALACPIMMGGMALFAWMFARGSKRGSEGDQSSSVAELRDEQQRIEAEIERHEGAAERAGEPSAKAGRVVAAGD